MAKAKAGIVYDSVVPGAFYRHTRPGHFTDVTTGIVVPGPKVRMSLDGSREIVGVTESPDPVQMPHYKLIVDFKDRDRKIQEKKEVPFDRQDELPLHDGFNQAISTGVIELVSDEEMAANYPTAWANRRERIVFSTEPKEEKPMGDLLSDFFVKKLSTEHEESKAKISATIAEAQAAASPPPPPSLV